MSRRLVVAFTLVLAAVPALHAQVRYDVVDATHLAKLLSTPCSIASGLKILPLKMYASPSGHWTAVVEETDPASVPYDRAQACIKLSSTTRDSRNVAVSDFRTLRLTWVNERLLYLFTDIGHVAGVGQLLDVEEGKWIYAKTEYYSDAPVQTGPREPPPPARQPDAIVIEAAKRSNVQDIDPKLPKMTFELWLRSVVGTQPTMKWGVTDCGEQTGNPTLDKGRDFPMCVEVVVSLAEKRDLILDIAMGTFGKGLTGGKPVLYAGSLKSGDKFKSIKTLSDVPTAIVGR